MDINFKAIVPMSAGKPAAFEELCCQLARRAERLRPFERLRGDGGDGGIEGFVDLPAGKRGWQAKYVFDTSSLVRQASKSFRTALENYADLKSFVLCFPFVPTGKTGRGTGDLQRLDDWRTSELHYAAGIGRDIEIEFWSASELCARIIEYDISGGMRHFFFRGQILTSQWLEDHLDQARATVGPRYTPELNVATDLAAWFAALGRTSVWSNALSARLRSLQEKLGFLHLSNTDTGKAEKAAESPFGDAWPDGSARRVATQVATIKEVIATLQRAGDLSRQKYSELKESLRSAADDLRDIGEELALEINRKHGTGAADSPSFRQYMAEWMASLPAANLDSTRNVVEALHALIEWLDSPAFALAFETSFVLTGKAGSGKTHGVCDIAHQRREEGLRTCLLFGHQFMNEPDPWTRIAETLGLIGLGRDRLLDAMDSAGEASGSPLLVCIDAINETKPLGYWRNHLMPMLQAVRSRRFLRVCIVCRTPYALACLPEQNKLIQVEHRGFSGHERDACRAYCKHYGLQPPATPALQPEMGNPLYLRLVCETAQSRGLQRLPPDWSGSVQAIEAFLHEKERRFADWHQVPEHANFMRNTLKALVDHLAAHAVTDVLWSAAVDAVLACMSGVDREQAARYLEWLVDEGLLIDDAPHEPYPGTEGTLRPAFERLGDFLVANAVLKDNTDIDLTPWTDTVGDIERHSGMLGVLSVLLPERDGVELPDMTDDPNRSNALLKLTVDSLPSRSGTAFTDRSEVLVRRALSIADLSSRTMEALVSVAWRPSSLDAHWLDNLLRSKALAERDAYWCAFLHHSFSKKGAVAELIEAAEEIPLEELDASVAERWAKLLLWFTAAADRRVKDGATRAAIAVLARQPTVLPTLIATMLSIDDDAVRERLLLVAYGVLLKARYLDTLKSVADMLQQHYTGDPTAFSNALIRDHIRAIYELATHLGVLPAGIDPKFASETKQRSPWPLPLPSDEDVDAWSQSIGLWPDEFHSDFFKYSMWCMDRWEGGMSRKDMAKWILQTIAQDFCFIGSGCEDYDQLMLRDHGGGRGKPVWAERIGKKYMWVAMHQLASHLHDKVVPKQDNGEPEPILLPFILAEGRQLDPSLLRRERSQRHQFFATPRLDTVGMSDDKAWIALEDVPTISELLQVQAVGAQQWRPLVAYLDSGRPDDRQYDGPFRQIWLRLLGYLVRPSHAALFFEKLRGRNFYGSWMPEGLRLGSAEGFVAEYPWATSFNVMPNEWYWGAGDRHLSEFLLPAWNDLSCGWEYDASLESTHVSVNVPARLFFDADGLWWDGEGGYRHEGRIVFSDPSIGRRGPSVLMVDAEYLGAKLRELDRCLIWTALGVKWMLGGSAKESKRAPKRTFSQVAWMDLDGTIQQSELVFFDDFNDKTRLA